MLLRVLALKSRLQATANKISVSVTLYFGHKFPAVLVNRNIKSVTQKRTDDLKQIDGQITVILPTIDPKN
jgi:hypothetical protein